MQHLLISSSSSSYSHLYVAIILHYLCHMTCSVLDTYLNQLLGHVNDIVCFISAGGRQPWINDKNNTEHNVVELHFAHPYFDRGI